MDSQGEGHLIVKGDITQVVLRCTSIEYHGKVLPINEEVKQSVSSVVDEMLGEGMKVIAVARKPLGNKTQITLDDEQNMILMG